MRVHVSLLVAVGITVACTTDSEGTTNTDGSDTGTETETGDPPAFEPTSGTWTQEETAVASNTCEPQFDTPEPPTTFTLDYDGGSSFQIEAGENDIVCEIDGTQFTCATWIDGPFEVPMFDAFITTTAVWEGELTSATTMTGTETVDMTCMGSGCSMLDTVPCMRESTWTGEFTG